MSNERSVKPTDCGDANVAALFADEPLAAACCNVLLLMYADAASTQATAIKAVSLLHAMSACAPAALGAVDLPNVGVPC